MKTPIPDNIVALHVYMAREQRGEWLNKTCPLDGEKFTLQEIVEAEIRLAPIHSTGNIHDVPFLRQWISGHKGWWGSTNLDKWLDDLVYNGYLIKQGDEIVAVSADMWDPKLQPRKD